MTAKLGKLLKEIKKVMNAKDAKELKVLSDETENFIQWGTFSLYANGELFDEIVIPATREEPEDYDTDALGVIGCDAPGIARAFMVFVEDRKNEIAAEIGACDEYVAEIDRYDAQELAADIDWGKQMEAEFYRQSDEAYERSRGN